jgi:hypothetical protein
LRLRCCRWQPGALQHGRLGGVLATGSWGAAAPRLLAPTVEALQTGPRYTRPPSLLIMASKVVLLGAFGVGKTCLLRQFVWGTFETKHTATIGVDFQNKTVHDPSTGQPAIRLQVQAAAVITRRGEGDPRGRGSGSVCRAGSGWARALWWWWR